MIRRIDWNGLSAIEFSKGNYTAVMVPSVGANLIRLADTSLGVEILRAPAPDETDVFLKRPHVFGLPILFPPNRIEDGRYTFNGRTYQFPITIEKEHNYHHGVLKSMPFVISRAVETEEYVLIEARYYSNQASEDIFRHFPHEFKCKIIYKLYGHGLEQEVGFTNESGTTMPIGVGFHTPMAIPFASGDAEDYVMRLSVGNEFELDGRNLPTGRRLPLSPRFAKLREGGLQVTECEPIEAGFSVKEIIVDGKPYRGAIVDNIRTGVSTFYEADEQTNYWTLWNNGGTVPYCCPEPQSWITNAPNFPDPRSAGFQAIDTGKSWKMKFRIYAR